MKTYAEKIPEIDFTVANDESWEPDPSEKTLLGTLQKRVYLFDYETTGLTDFDQPIQFVSRSLNSASNTAQQCSLNFRLNAGCLPHPKALMVNGKSFKELRDKERPSLYFGMRAVHDHFIANPNTAYTAFNAQFDTRVTENALYQNGLFPYPHRTNSRTTFCAREYALTLARFSGGKFRVNCGPDGRYNTKQEALVAANGLSSYQAHDAEDDVEALRELFQYCLQCCPELVPELNSCLHKELLRQNASNADFYTRTVFSASSGVGSDPQVVLGAHSIYSNQLVALRVKDLSAADLNGGELVTKILKTKGKGLITTLKPNSSPLIICNKSRLIDRIYSPEEQLKWAQLGRSAKNQTELLRVANKVLQERISEYPEAQYPEQQRVSGGFFSPEDARALNEFHQAIPVDKYSCIEKISDDRLVYFLNRVFYNNWPSLLPPEILKSIDEEIEWRLTTRKSVPWLTIQSALDAIEECLADCSQIQSSKLLAYRTDLLHLATNPIQRVSEVI